MSTEEMKEYIEEALETADEYVIQQIYEYLQEVEYWKIMLPAWLFEKGGRKHDS